MEINALTKLTSQAIKAQEEYTANTKRPDLPMFTHTEIPRAKRPVPPSYEVRIKSARLKKQEKHDKLTPKAFKYYPHVRGDIPICNGRHTHM